MVQLLCVFIGLATGIVSALCGVGGGIIMVPAFVCLLKLGQKEAVATSLVAIILTALAASLRNSSSHLVNWPVALATGLAAAMAAWFAAGWLKSFSNVTLTRIFAILVLVIGMQMLWSSFRQPPAGPGSREDNPSERKP